MGRWVSCLPMAGCVRKHPRALRGQAASACFRAHRRTATANQTKARVARARVVSRGRMRREREGVVPRISPFRPSSPQMALCIGKTARFTLLQRGRCAVAEGVDSAGIALKPAGNGLKPGGFWLTSGGCTSNPGGFEPPSGGSTVNPGGFEAQPDGIEVAPGGFEPAPAGREVATGGFRSESRQRPGAPAGGASPRSASFRSNCLCGWSRNR